MALVNVPVPEDRIQEVYELLAKPGRERSADRRYDLASMEQLWKEVSPEIRKVLKHLMRHAEERVPTADLIEVAGVAGGRVLGGMFARLRAQCLKRYKRDLPWETITIGDNNFYVLSKENADLVNRVY
jgi:hypothetical protein